MKRIKIVVMIAIEDEDHCATFCPGREPFDPFVRCGVFGQVLKQGEEDFNLRCHKCKKAKIV